MKSSGLAIVSFWYFQNDLFLVREAIGGRNFTTCSLTFANGTVKVQSHQGIFKCLTGR